MASVLGILTVIAGTLSFDVFRWGRPLIITLCASVGPLTKLGFPRTEGVLSGANLNSRGAIQKGLSRCRSDRNETCVAKWLLKACPTLALPSGL
jgi:hypothetical protein